MGICGYPIPFLMARGNHWRYRTVSSIPNSWQGCPAAFLAECTLLWGFGRRGVIMNLQKLRGSVGTRLLPCSLPECAALARSALASWLSRIIASRPGFHVHRGGRDKSRPYREDIVTTHDHCA